MTKAELFKNIYANHVRSQTWLDGVPPEINQAFFDNPHIECLYSTQTMLIRAYFGEWAESIEWFLYEWKPGYTVCAPGSDTEVEINSIDEYITFMQDNEGFPLD